jgi:integrase
MYQMEWRENGRRLGKSLKHRDWDQAKRQADEFAANYVASQSAQEPEPLTLGRLFEMYLGEVTPKNSKGHRRYARSAARMFGEYFGPNRLADTFSWRDFDRFSAARAGGTIASGSGAFKPVQPRTVQMDLSFLSSVLNWATTAGDGRGGFLLDRNPMKGYKLPREKNPRRVMITDEEYSALLTISKEFDWRFHVALVLAHETGHRIGAIRKLTWSDVDLTSETIRWRAEHDKKGYEHVTPMSSEARAVLEFAKEGSPGVDDLLLLPASKDPSKPIGEWVIQRMWQKAERIAGLERKKGRGWHSLRRKFASDLKDLPLRVLCDLGGWKDFETVLKCYQQADESELREALAARKRVLSVPNSGNEQRELRVI